jgi:chemotaxis protein histidine kinase CheA
LGAKTMKLLLVNGGEGRYAVPADEVTRIVDPALEPDFGVEEGTGEVRCGGVRYPMLDLARGGRDGGRLYLLVRRGGDTTAVAVDSAEAIREIPGGAVAPLPPFIFAGARRLVRGLFSDGRGPRLLLDVDAVR